MGEVRIALGAMIVVGVLLWSGPLLAVSPFNPPPSVDWEGQAITPERLAGGVTVVLAVDNQVKDIAALATEELLYQFGADPHFQLLRVTDLVNVPGFAGEIVVSTIKKRDGAELAAVRARFQSEGKEVPALVAQTSYILDWEGKLRQALLQASPRPEFAIFKQPPGRQTRFKTREQQAREQLDHHLHLFVLDAEGEVISHYLDAAELPRAVVDVRERLTELEPPTLLIPSSGSTPG